jgi:hypothetical protein
MRSARIVAPGLALLLVGDLLVLGCSGIVAPEPPVGGSSQGGGGGSGGPGGAGGSSGGVAPEDAGVVPPGRGGADAGPAPSCAGLPVPDIAKVCPDGTTVGGTYVSENGVCVLEFLCPAPPPPSCAPGAPCQPKSACATASAGGSSSCAESCTCDSTGHYACQMDCSDGSTPTGCTQGAACTPNSGCGGGTVGGCATSCSCDPTGHLQCTTTCPTADAGCVDNVDCVAGDHWDPAACKCVPDACISQVGGPCGGFVANPCQCAAGLVCVDSGVPDKGGTCQKGPVCAPTPCPSAATFDPVACKCVVPNCATAADCTGPLPLSCQVCGDGAVACAHWSCVAGQCQTTFCS